MHRTRRLLELMQTLRDPERGCPWDRAQNFASLARHTLEEAYELVDAIQRNEPEELRAELGDLLFQVVFYAQLAKEQGLFDFEAIAAGLADKLVRRHPHVFGAGAGVARTHLAVQWEQVKEQERRARNATASALDGVALALPALSRASALQKRAARCGFDWHEREGVLDKIAEEFAELRAALKAGEEVAVREELGDFLFSAVNLARHLGADAETALRGTNDKFVRRFRAIEARLRAVGCELSEASAAELDAHWEAVKAAERG